MQTTRPAAHRWHPVLGLVGLVACWSTSARASEVFPGALQEAADMQCVPVCTMCHTSNPGSEGTWTSKPLPLALSGITKMVNGMPVRVLKKRDADSLKEAFAIYAQTADAATLERVRTGHEPGSNEDVCGPTYGCGAHVAKEAAAPRDWSGPLWLVAAVVAGAVLRRRRRSNAF